MPESIPAICLAGPTGAGKTALAIALAARMSCEIINADSRQVYADFPILTAQPDKEEMSRAPHHLYGFLPTDEKINAGKWVEIASNKAREIRLRGNIPLFVGGTGLYFHALLHGLANIPPIPQHIAREVLDMISGLGSEAVHAKLARIDPDYARRIHPHDKNRIQRAFEVYRATGKTFTWWHNNSSETPACTGPLLVIDAALDELAPDLDSRIDHMLNAGCVAEAEKAWTKCPDASAPGWTGIGCAEMAAWLERRVDWPECRRLWLANTRAYAKRQLTWFRAKKEAVWIGRENMDNMLKKVCGIFPLPGFPEVKNS